MAKQLASSKRLNELEHCANRFTPCSNNSLCYMSLLRKAERCLKNQQSHKLLNAFITASKDEAALEQELQDAQSRHDSRKAKSPVDGTLIAIKDNICTSEGPTTCASALLAGFRSPYQATVIERLTAAGAVIVGKTNLDEFGMGTYSANSINGPVKNIYTQDSENLVAGGSSGGSAVAVATDQCDAALGTDTGGSVRFPAACTGIVGFKPSYGMVSRWGVVAYANSLDTVGVLARSTLTASKVFGAINGPDIRDPTSVSAWTRSKIVQQIEERKARLGWGDGPSLRIGVPMEYNTEEMQPVIRNTWLDTLQRLRDLGHSIHKLSLPATKHALPAYYVLAPAEASSNLAKYDGVRYGSRSADRVGNENVLYASTRGAGLGEEVKRRILLGSFSLSASAIGNYFIQAQKLRRLVQQDFNNVFRLQHPLLEGYMATVKHRGVDIILAPTAQSLPPKLSSLKDRDPTDAYAADVLTVPASLAGLPAMNVPVRIPPFDSNEAKPINSVGLQLVGQYGDDNLVLHMARVIELSHSNS